MKNNIIEASELPFEEKVYLKKDWLGWRIVEPVYDEDGNFSWKKLIVGTKRGWFQISIYIIIAVLLYLGVNELISNYKIIADNPCEYCFNISKNINTMIIPR